MAQGAGSSCIASERLSKYFAISIQYIRAPTGAKWMFKGRSITRAKSGLWSRRNVWGTVTPAYLLLTTAPWFFFLTTQAEDRRHSISPLALSCFAVGWILVVVIFVARPFLRRFNAKRIGEYLLISNAPDAMLLLRVQNTSTGEGKLPSFVIQAANSAAAARLRSFGHASNFIERNIDEVFPQSIRQLAKKEYCACVAGKEERRYKITPPGGAVTLESIAAPILDSAGELVTHVVVVTRDIVEHVRHERELADALWQAQQANKSKAEFLASMSHELRTPLNAVLGYSEMLQRQIGGELSQKHKEYAEFIHQIGRAHV